MYACRESMLRRSVKGARMAPASCIGAAKPRLMALRQRVGDSNVSYALEPQRDRHGRALGVCSLGGGDLNAWLVSEGHALAYRRYSLKYVDQEKEARAAGRGVGGRLRSALGLAVRRAVADRHPGWLRKHQRARSMPWPCTTTTTTAALHARKRESTASRRCTETTRRIGT